MLFSCRDDSLESITSGTRARAHSYTLWVLSTVYLCAHKTILKPFPSFFFSSSSSSSSQILWTLSPFWFSHLHHHRTTIRRYCMVQSCQVNALNRLLYGVTQFHNSSSRIFFSFLLFVIDSSTLFFCFVLNTRRRYAIEMYSVLYTETRTSIVCKITYIGVS